MVIWKEFGAAENLMLKFLCDNSIAPYIKLGIKTEKKSNSVPSTDNLQQNNGIERVREREKCAYVYMYVYEYVYTYVYHLYNKNKETFSSLSTL